MRPRMQVDKTREYNKNKIDKNALKSAAFGTVTPRYFLAM